VRLVANVWVLSGFDPKNNQTHGLVNSMSHHVPPTHLGDFEHPLQMDVGSRRQALPGKPLTPEVEASRQVFLGSPVLETRGNKQTLQGNQYS
jgi:hypothetical protein